MASPKFDRYSDVSSIKSNSASSLHVKSIIPQPKTGIDEPAYKHQRICKVCGLNLKEKLIGKKAKKYFCKFCYEAVCANCSCLKCYHNVLKKSKRICIGCFNEAVEKNVRGSVEDRRQSIQSNISYTSDVDIEKKLEDMAEKLNRKKSKLLKINKKIQEGMKLSLAESKIESKDSQEIIALENSLYEKTKDLEKLKKKAREATHTFNQIQNSISMYNEKIDKLQNQSLDTRPKTPQKKAGFIEILKDQIVNYRGLLNTRRHDIQKLKLKVDKLKRKN